MVVKSAEGFADRLQVVSHAIEYCKKFNAALCVDWSDGIWGNGLFDFHHVFEIGNGIKTMDKISVLKLVATGKVKVNPPCWTLKDIAEPMNARTCHIDFRGPLHNSTSTVDKVEGDVIIMNGYENRGWYFVNILKHIRMLPHVATEVRALLEDFNPNSVVVHLRGTDRPDPEFTKHAIIAVKQFPEEAPIYVVTDAMTLYEEFKTAIPKATLVNPSSSVLKIPPNEDGTHKMIPPLMKKYGLSKWRMVIELLAEFVAIWSAQWAVGKRHSFYFRLARQMSRITEDAMKSFMRGWTPYIKYPRIQEEIDEGYIPPDLASLGYNADDNKTTYTLTSCPSPLTSDQHPQDAQYGWEVQEHQKKHPECPAP